MTYKESLTQAMNELAADPLVRFIGYGVRHGARAGGTLKDVPEAQLIETPVAENLMVGMAIGMSLAGLRPVVYIERFDFILNALDAIVNHLDKLDGLSRGVFQPAIILRVVVGNKDKPLHTGATHVQDFSEAMRKMVNFPVIQLTEQIGFSTTEHVLQSYRGAYQRLQRPVEPYSSMLVEYKDLL